MCEKAGAYTENTINHYKVKVLHLGQIHKPDDRRIWQKECGSLISSGKYDVVYYTSDKYRSASSDPRIKYHSMQRSAFCSCGHLKKSKEELNNIINTESPRIIHIHEYEIAYFIPYIKKKYPSIKVIYDVHENNSGHYYENYELKYGRIVGRIVEWLIYTKDLYYAKKADRVLTVAEYLVDRFSRKQTTTLIRNYPIIERRIDLNSCIRKRNQICYVGGIGYNKGSYLLCRIARRIEGMIIFAGSISSDFQDDFWNELNHNNNLVYAGFLDSEEINDLLQKSGIGYCALKKTPGNYNASANKLYEYMMAGLPVICSNFPKWKEIVVGCKCGIVVDPDDEDEIAEAINYLISHPDEARKMGENGHRAVEKIYNWDKESQKLLELYRELDG